MAIVNQRLRVRRGRRAGVRFLSTTAGAAVLEVRRGGRRVARVTGVARYGTNRLVWRTKRTRPGRYTLRLAVTDAEGRTARDTVPIRVLR